MALTTPPDGAELADAFCGLLKGFMPAMEVLAEAPNSRRLLESQSTAKRLLPGLRRVHAARLAAAPLPPLTDEDFQTMGALSPAALDQEPQPRQVAYFERLLKEQARRHYRGSTEATLQKQYPNMTPEQISNKFLDTKRPFVPPRITNAAGNEMMNAPPLVIQLGDELARATKLRSQAAFSTEKILDLVHDLPLASRIPLLVPAIAVLRDNTAIMLRIVDKAVGASFKPAGRELARRVQALHAKSSGDSSLPLILCPCKSQDAGAKYRSQISERIDLLPAVSRLLYHLDATRIVTLMNTTWNHPGKWATCVHCEFAVFLSGRHAPLQRLGNTSRCCSLEKTDFGSEKCDSCKDANRPSCHIPCNEHRDAIRVLLDFIMVNVGTESHPSVLSSIANLLSKNCNSCQIRKHSEVVPLVEVDDDIEDADYQPGSSEGEDGQSLTDEESGEDDDEDGTAQVDGPDTRMVMEDTAEQQTTATSTGEGKRKRSASPSLSSGRRPAKKRTTVAPVEQQTTVAGGRQGLVAPVILQVGLNASRKASDILAQPPTPGRGPSGPVPAKKIVPVKGGAQSRQNSISIAAGLTLPVEQQQPVAGGSQEPANSQQCTTCDEHKPMSAFNIKTKKKQVASTCISCRDAQEKRRANLAMFLFFLEATSFTLASDVDDLFARQEWTAVQDLRGYRKTAQNGTRSQTRTKIRAALEKKLTNADAPTKANIALAIGRI